MTGPVLACPHPMCRPGTAECEARAAEAGQAEVQLGVRVAAELTRALSTGPPRQTLVIPPDLVEQLRSELEGQIAEEADRIYHGWDGPSDRDVDRARGRWSQRWPVLADLLSIVTPEEDR